MALNFNSKYAAEFIRENDLAGLTAQVEAAHDMLHNKTGLGNDFLGWVNLPFDYDKEEFARIKKAAEKIISDTDILIHTESFDETIIPKLRYAFSTKIAQCMCAGRCFVSFAPAQTASSQYLAEADGAIFVSNEAELRSTLQQLIADPALRQAYAHRSAKTGRENHHMQTIAQRVQQEVDALFD